MLSTEVAYYDAASSGDLVSRLAADMVLFNLATGPKVGVLLQAGSTFISGLVIGLYQGWRLALVLLGFVPLLALVGATTARWVAASTGREASAYAKAGALAQEVFASIRTVAAFTGEPATQRRYAEALHDTLRMGILQKVVASGGSGTSASSRIAREFAFSRCGTHAPRSPQCNCCRSPHTPWCSGTAPCSFARAKSAAVRRSRCARCRFIPP